MNIKPLRTYVFVVTSYNSLEVSIPAHSYDSARRDLTAFMDELIEEHRGFTCYLKQAFLPYYLPEDSEQGKR